MRGHVRVRSRAGGLMDAPTPTEPDAATRDAKALDRIAWILATPSWSVGMLEDIAAIVAKSGHTCPEHTDYIHH